MIVQSEDGFTIISTMGSINSPAEASQELCMEMERQALIAGDNSAQLFWNDEAARFGGMRHDFYLRLDWRASETPEWNLVGKACKSSFETAVVRCSVKMYGPAPSESEAERRWFDGLRFSRFFEFRTAPTAAIMEAGSAPFNPKWRYNQAQPIKNNHAIPALDNLPQSLASRRGRPPNKERNDKIKAALVKFPEWRRDPDPLLEALDDGCVTAPHGYRSWSAYSAVGPKRVREQIEALIAAD